MKLLISAVFAFSTTALAAQTEPQIKPQAGNWSTEATFYAQTGSNALRFGLNDIKIRRFSSDRMVQRFRLLATQNNETTVIVGSMGNMERSIKEGSFFIAPGFEKHLVATRRLSPYWGTELVLGKSFYEYNLTNSTNGQTFTQGGTFNTTTKKSVSMGANMIFGADFYLGKQLFIGAEVGYGFLYQNFGNSHVTVQNNGNITDQRTVPMGKNQGLKLFANPGIRVGITL